MKHNKGPIWRWSSQLNRKSSVWGGTTKENINKILVRVGYYKRELLTYFLGIQKKQHFEVGTFKSVKAQGIS